MNRSATARPFGIRDKVGYLFGDFGNDFTFIFSTMMLMKFYTDVMGVSAGVVGLVMTAAAPPPPVSSSPGCAVCACR